MRRILVAHPCRRPLPLAALLLLLRGPAASAHAQDSSAAVETPSLKVEVGAAVSDFMPTAGTFPVGVRVSLARKQPFTFEVAIDWRDLGRKKRYVDQMTWFYFWQVKQELATQDEAGPRFFVTYGAAGGAIRASDANGFSSAFMPPVFPLLGFGGQHVVAKYAAVRVDGQVWLLGKWVKPRFSGSVSVPIGGYRR